LILIITPSSPSLSLLTLSSQLFVGATLAAVASGALWPSSSSEKEKTAKKKSAEEGEKALASSSSSSTHSSSSTSSTDPSSSLALVAALDLEARSTTTARLWGLSDKKD